MMPDDYQVPNDPNILCYDADTLRTLLGLRGKRGEPPPELPVEVRRVYYDMSLLLERQSAKGPTMDRVALATVVMFAQREMGVELPPKEPPPFSMMDEVDAGRLVPGQKVVVKWPVKDQPGHFIRKSDGKMRLLVKGQERNHRPDLVRYPEEGEFPGVVDNINQPAGA